VRSQPERSAARGTAGLRPDGALTTQQGMDELAQRAAEPARDADVSPEPRPESTPAEGELRPDGAACAGRGAESRRTKIIRFDASADLRDKLARLQALMRSSVPGGDLAQVIEIAVTEKLERLEAKRFGRSRAPRKTLGETDTTPRSRYIPAAVRRVVHERDGGRCTYRDDSGRRCTRRHDLEFHHQQPFGRGGVHSPKVLTLMCRAHNALMAERDYGKETMARFRRAPSRTSEPTAVYATARGRRRAEPWTRAGP